MQANFYFVYIISSNIYKQRQKKTKDLEMNYSLLSFWSHHYKSKMTHIHIIPSINVNQLPICPYNVLDQHLSVYIIGTTEL